MRIRYSKGYKYQMREDYSHPWQAPDVSAGFIGIKDNVLHIRAGYAWDGPSGPTFDTPSFMRGSLVHDALYQLIREGHLPRSAKQAADDELRRICIEDGMSALRAWWVHRAVAKFGTSATINNKQEYWAP